MSIFHTSLYGPSRFLTCLLTPVLGHCGQEGREWDFPHSVFPSSGTSPQADSQLAGTLPSLSSPWGSPAEHVAAQATSQQVHKTVLYHAHHHVIHHHCCSVTTGLSLIAFGFNESRWTLRPQRSDYRQGNVDVWLSLAEQLHTAAAKLNFIVVG